MRRVVLKGKPPNHPTCFWVGIGSTVSLPVFHHHQSIRTYRQVLSALIEQIVKVESKRTSLLNESPTEIIPEPFDDRTGGHLTTFHHVLAGNHSVGEGTKEPRSVDGLLGHAGVLVVVGFTMGRIELRLSNLMAFDATVQGTWGCRPELYPDALALVTSGRVTLKPFIECHPMSEGPDLIRRVADHEIRRRVILVPGARP